MSKTKFVTCGNSHFWAYDVALNVFLKHLIDAAETSEEADKAWPIDSKILYERPFTR